MAKQHTSKRANLKFVECKNDSEAIVSIVSGLVWFLRTHTKKTVIVLIVLFGALGIILNDYLDARQNKQTIDIAKPIGQTVSFSFMPEALAGTKGDSIVINGQFYGMIDKDFDCWKIQGRPIVLLHAKSDDLVLSVEVPKLTQVKQFKK